MDRTLIHPGTQSRLLGLASKMPGKWLKISQPWTQGRLPGHANKLSLKVYRSQPSTSCSFLTMCLGSEVNAHTHIHIHAQTNTGHQATKEDKAGKSSMTTTAPQTGSRPPRPPTPTKTTSKMPHPPAPAAIFEITVLPRARLWAACSTASAAAWSEGCGCMDK